MPSPISRPLAGSAFSPSKAATRRGLAGMLDGSRNSLAFCTPHAPRSVRQGNQAVRFTAAEAGIQAKDGGNRGAVATSRPITCRSRFFRPPVG